MAYEIPGFKFTGVCGAASLADKQYYFVKQHTDGTIIVCAAIADHPVGILQNCPAVGQECEIMVTGISKVSSDEALTYGDIIICSADGQAAKSADGANPTAARLGQCVWPSGAAGELASIMFSCLNYTRDHA